MIPGMPSGASVGAIQVSIGTVNNADLFALAGSPTAPVVVEVNVTGTVGAALNPGGSRPNPALKVIGFAAGSVISITGDGKIAGGGGIGGQGDRGRRDNTSASSFVGGGGGGGAGSSSQGGAAATEADPDDTSTDGTAGTTTTGGTGGVNSSGVGIPSAGHTLGTAAQGGGHGLVIEGAITVYIDATNLDIWAGADGGAGGYQNGPGLPGAGVAPANGASLATSLTENTGAHAFPMAVSVKTGATVNWIGGKVYPNLRGYLTTGVP